MAYCVLIIINRDDPDDRHIGIYASTHEAHGALLDFVNKSPIADPEPLSVENDSDIVRAFDLIATETPYVVCLESDTKVGAPLVCAVSA
jgi:hypothetical protein